MKKTRSNELKAAIFLIVATVLLVGIVLRVSGTLEALTRETYTIRVRFDNVTGISTSSRVTLNGVRVGSVKRIQLLPEDPKGANVELELELDRGQARLYQDAQAVITAETLLSEKQVDLLAGTRDTGKRLGPGAVIYGEPTRDVSCILAKADQVMEAVRDFLTDEKLKQNVQTILEEAKMLVVNLREFATLVEETMKRNRGKIDSVIDNVEVTSQNLTQLTEQLSQAVEEIQQDLQETLKSAGALVDENRPDVRETVEHVRKAAESLSNRIDPLLERAHQLAEQLNDAVGDNRDELDRVLDNIERTSENVKTLSKQLSDYPWQMVYPLDKRRETRTLYPAWMPASATGEQP